MLAAGGLATTLEIEKTLKMDQDHKLFPSYEKGTYGARAMGRAKFFLVQHGPQ